MIVKVTVLVSKKSNSNSDRNDNNTVLFGLSFLLFFLLALQLRPRYVEILRETHRRSDANTTEAYRKTDTNTTDKHVNAMRIHDFAPNELKQQCHGPRPLARAFALPRPLAPLPRPRAGATTGSAGSCSS